MTNTLGNQQSRRKTKYDNRSAEDLKARVMSVKPKKQKTVKSKIEQTATTSDECFYFYIKGDEYMLGTPEKFVGIGKKTNIPFYQFVESQKLQKKLGFNYSQPDPFASPQAYENEKRVLGVTLANKLTSDSITKEERILKKDYLYDDGIITIHTPNTQGFNKINLINHAISMDKENKRAKKS
jgi:hypothetical protein